MSLPVDLELKRAFMNLQTKMLETSKKIQAIDSQIVVLKRIVQHVDITREEILALPPKTNTYESVGRMFVLADIEESGEYLSLKIALLDERILEMEHTKRYLEKNLRESQDNLREMVQQRKEQLERYA